MPLGPLFGHDAVRERLGTAAHTGRLPQAIMLSGPRGTGKQRLALWLGQALLCDDGGPQPCGHCPSCRLVLDLAHPDLHWFVPLPRLKAGDTAKQIEEVKGALAEALAERRERGHWQPPDGTNGHWLASVHLLQRIVAVTPFRGARKVVVLGDAERLVVQEANLEAANALLKLLEEPPADTVVILTATEPQALLATIRSRVVPIRIGPLGDDVVRTFAAHEVDTEARGTALERLVALADGCPGRLFQAAGKDATARNARTFLEASEAGGPAWVALALAQPPWGARGEFANLLDALAVALRERLRTAAGIDDRRALLRALTLLHRLDAVRESLGINVNPQLALAELGRALEAAA